MWPGAPPGAGSSASPPAGISASPRKSPTARPRPPRSITRCPALELASYGITANMVYPPVTDTGWVTDAVRDYVAASPHHVHVASAGEVAAVIAYLASDEARL